MKYTYLFILMLSILLSCNDKPTVKKEIIIEQNVEFLDSVILDKRDNQQYKIIKVGDKLWMAENLNYRDANSMYYKYDSLKYSKYGRLYFGLSINDCLCPENWKIPTYTDFHELIEYYGGYALAAKQLKSKEGWKNNQNGENTSGFNAYPAGNNWYSWNRKNPHVFSEVGELAAFWGSDTTILFYLTEDNLVYRSNFSYNDSMAFSIRCVFP